MKNNQATTLLSQLVSISSISGSEARIADFIYAWLKNHGVNAFKQAQNVVAKVEGKDSGQAIILNGHMDTVKPGDRNKWQTDPFDPVLKGDRLYGLGASDMKGSLAAMMIFAQKLVTQQPVCDVWFSFVVKEELDGSGTKSFLKWFKEKGYLKKYQGIAAVIGEPTGLKTIELGHKGNAFIKVSIKGQSGHGSRPEAIKEHAILKMNQLIAESVKQVKIWQKKYQDKYLGMPTLGLTGIKAGSFKCPNKFPDQCQAQFDLRTTPALHQVLEKEIKNWLAKSGASFQFIAKPAPFGWCDPEEKIVFAIKAAIRGIKLNVSHGASDQCFFTLLGIPAVIFGPGEKTIIHQENEWIDLKEVGKALSIYQKVVVQFTTVPESPTFLGWG
ncbi:hypothetical protein A2160_04640 [Candidatus Beckwithbacteria bacterium RBG_13_42_9]|uniref:Peptidase M20 dimerisation domain-containing protein n=1 Tax=Candidatus Beckwithbacteria bacterium RBG_13_42_9 TaxID=1797457 RepID=A0A1F5E3X5_9BACT|nr:MAG: hypothetical protein A2160_04640 [Candidatus Beckwithbacteria bacterium RBG_13_42_9]